MTGNENVEDTKTKFHSLIRHFQQ